MEAIVFAMLKDAANGNTMLPSSSVGGGTHACQLQPHSQVFSSPSLLRPLVPRFKVEDVIQQGTGRRCQGAGWKTVAGDRNPPPDTKGGWCGGVDVWMCG